VATFIASRFSGSDGSDGSDGWPSRGEVILNLPAAEVSPFLHDGVVEELGPDRCRLILGSWSWPALAGTIGRFDADIEVVRPTELKDAFAHLASATPRQRPTDPPRSNQWVTDVRSTTMPADEQRWSAALGR
jgi:hypothetical protein